MTRHAKNAAAMSIFSHAERSRLTYGTQSRRAGLDSQRVFDSCELCLTTASNPVLCQAGHLFCRGCVLEWIAHQKEGHKLLAKKYETQQAEQQAREKRNEEKEQSERERRFEAGVGTVLAAGAAASSSSASSSSSGVPAPAGYVRVQTTSGGGYVIDRELVSKLASESGGQAQETKKAILPCFWLPSMAPSDVGEARLPAANASVKEQCMCPGGSGHVLKLKHLKPVKWNIDRMGTATPASASASDESKSSSSSSPTVGRPQCFSCKKALSNQTPMACVRSCGHVSCKRCVDTLMLNKKVSQTLAAASAASSSASTTPASSSSSSHSAPASLICLECDRPCKQEDIVPIVAAGGFAASGATVAKKALTPAFRC
jgi:nitric oxide synthase-interacting protein